MILLWNMCFLGGSCCQPAATSSSLPSAGGSSAEGAPAEECQHHRRHVTGRLCVSGTVRHCAENIWRSTGNVYEKRRGCGIGRGRWSEGEMGEGREKEHYCIAVVGQISSPTISAHISSFFLRQGVHFIRFLIIRVWINPVRYGVVFSLP